ETTSRVIRSSTLMPSPFFVSASILGRDRRAGIGRFTRTHCVVLRRAAAADMADAADVARPAAKARARRARLPEQESGAAETALAAEGGKSVQAAERCEGLVRQREVDGRAALGAVLRPDPAAVCLDDPARDRQTEPRLAAGARSVAAPEALEHARLRLLLEPVSRVLDGDPHLLLLRAHPYRDRAV